MRCFPPQITQDEVGKSRSHAEPRSTRRREIGLEIDSLLPCFRFIRSLLLSQSHSVSALSAALRETCFFRPRLGLFGVENSAFHAPTNLWRKQLFAPWSPSTPSIRPLEAATMAMACAICWPVRRHMHSQSTCLRCTACQKS